MNVENGTETAQFPEKEYINGIFVAVQYRSGLFLAVTVTVGFALYCITAAGNIIGKTMRPSLLIIS